MIARSRKRRSGAKRIRKLQRPAWMQMDWLGEHKLTLPKLRINLWGGVLCAIMGLFGSAAVIASQHLLGDFQVSRIEVEGDLVHLRPGQVQARLDELLLNQKTRSDLADIQAQLLSQPWISEARVRRTWPDGLQIEVIEQRPVARWNNTQFLGMQGELFQPIKQPLLALPSLAGPAGSEHRVFSQYERWKGQLAELGLELEQAQLDPALGWRLTLASGIEIELGRLELDQRLERFAKAWRKRLVTTPDIARVDLRYRHGLALTFESENNG